MTLTRQARYAAAKRAVVRRCDELRAELPRVYSKVPRVTVEVGGWTSAAAGAEGLVEEVRYTVRFYDAGHPIVDLVFTVTATDEEIQADIDEALARAMRRDLLPEYEAAGDGRDEEVTRPAPLPAEHGRTPLVDPLRSFPSFAEHVRARLELGRSYEAARPAVTRATGELLDEIQDELADVAGWSACLWARIEALKTRVAEGSAAG